MADVDYSTVTQSERMWLRDHGGPNVTTIVYEGVGHNVQRTHFEALVEDVQKWV